MDTNQLVKEIFNQGDYRRIRDDLKKAGLLNGHEDQIREKYAKRFLAMGFEPEEKIWEMMAIEDLYDTLTFKHSVRVSELVYKIITKKLTSPNGENLILQTFIEKRGVSLRDITVAALGHDIGKIKIPLEVLHNTLGDKEMNQILIDMIHRGIRKKEVFERIGFKKDDQKSDEEILIQLYNKGLRAVNVVPLSEAFPEEKHPGFSEILKKRGFSPEQTIKQIAVSHEAAGQKIFETLDEPIIADLVGNHHNYKKKDDSEMKYKMNIPALHSDGASDKFGVCNIIKIADQLDSLQSSRPYKKAMTRLSALAELAHQADTGRMDKRLLYLWIDNEYQELKEKMESGALDPITLEQEQKSIEQVKEFLKETKKIFKKKFSFFSFLRKN
ncbi:MAG: hypothetical protein NT098_02805 [Candidatus Parcubacteria bacterium]|nr:hypothetical protein [Candidatus Parcubacteria bacterium]